MKATPFHSAVQAAASPGERALEHFLSAGFVRLEPPILHPAAIFLDMSGEDQAAASPGERALEHFVSAGFVRLEPPILHPAATFSTCRRRFAAGCS